MVDVNKILNIEDEKEEIKEKKESIKDKSPIEKLYHLSNTLKESIGILDIAIKRKVSFTQISFENQNGIRIFYEPVEFSTKVKKFSYKVTLKNIDKIIEENSFNIILDELLTNYENYTKLDTRLLFYSNKKYIGFNKNNNTIFTNYENGKMEFLLFNKLNPDFTDFEKEILNRNKPVEIIQEDIKNDIDIITKSSTNDVDNVDITTKEKKEKDEFSFLKTLDDVDLMLEKYKK